MELHKKKVLVVGLGKSGFSVVRWLYRMGANVMVSEMRDAGELDGDLIYDLSEKGISMETGGHRIETFLDADMIVVSPGVPLDIKPIQASRDKGIPVMGELELASRVVCVPIVAVTGTNGKSTVTALIGAMTKEAGLEVFVGGNIGTPLMDYMASEKSVDYAVVEVSSFQLDSMETFSPDISLLLNISPDHLDRYRDYHAYQASKLRIFQNQGRGQYAILNDDDKVLERFEPSGDVSVLRYGRNNSQKRQAFIEGATICATANGSHTHTFDIRKVKLLGEHNRENIMGGILAGLAMGLNSRSIQRTIDHFKGLPHRLEWLGHVNEVLFVNDSKATNVEAAVKAVGSFNRPVILIAGGRHKGSNYTPLVRASKGRVKYAVFLGESREMLGKAFRNTIPFTFARDMMDAVLKGFSAAEANDVVMLAPACASFDMFTDYAQRGDVFKQAVERLKNDG